MISDILKQFDGKRIMVLGDVMLDHYVWGKVERISPEAPVPVLEAQSEEYRLGGSANVALNVRSLGAEVVLFGVIGSDNPADVLCSLLLDKGIGSEGLIIDPDRSTTLKTRIGAVNQQIVRLDYESKSEIGEEVSAQLLSKIEELIASCDALIIEDYNKGLLTSEVIAAAISSARKHGIPVAVDPKLKNFLNYRSVEIFKPNYKEMQAVTGTPFENETEFINAAKRLRERMQVQNLIITRGSKGLYIFDAEDSHQHLPTYARDVYDVSGAGDTVISALTLAYISGADIRMAAEIANHAAGVVCGIMGTACISREDILASYNEQR